MSKLQFRPRVAFTAASALIPYQPVSLLGGASALDDTVVRSGSVNDLPIGFTVASVAAGAAAAILLGGVAKGVAAASLGNGALVGVGSTNGRLIPLTASGAASVANYPVRYIVGVALEDAVDAGEFKVLLRPSQLI